MQYPMLAVVGAAGISATASPDGSGDPLPISSIYESGWSADVYNQVQSAIQSGQLTLASETAGPQDSEYTRSFYALDIGKLPPAHFVWLGHDHLLPWGAFTIWDSAAGAAYGMHLRRPDLQYVDANYGNITLPQNVYWAPTGVDKVSSVVMAVGEKMLITFATGQIEASIAGATMDAFDFIDTGDILVNNDPGLDFGSTDPFTADYADAVSNTNVDASINDMLNNTDAPAFDADVNNQGVIDELSNGTNVQGDSANLTDEPGSASNNNGATPKGGGLNPPSRGNAPGTPVAAPAQTPSNISSPYYTPPNPRAVQSPVQGMFNPPVSGMFPIYNPSPNPGYSTAYGTGPSPTVNPGQLAPGAVSLGLPANPMLLIGGAIVVAALLLK
jgi:hypothetical protein